MCVNINCNCNCYQCLYETCCDPCPSVPEDGCLSTTPLGCTNYSGDAISCGGLSITIADTGDEVIKKITDYICGITDTLSDKFVRTRSSDTTSGYLYDKLVGSDYIGISVVSPNSNEKLKLDVKLNALIAKVLEQVPVDKYVKVSSTDTTSNYLLSKLTTTTGISIDKQNSGGNENVRFSLDISPVDGNIISIDEHGLFVPTPPTFTETPLVANNSSTILIQQSGTAGHTITASAKISTEADNALIDNSGLFVGVADSTTVDFYLAGSGTSKRITGDVKISSVSGNSLINNSGLYVPTFPTYSVQDTSTIDLDATSNIITANAKISTIAGNILVDNSGLYVPTTLETPLVINDSSTIDFTQSGDSNHTVTGEVKLSTTPGNRLVNSGGLYVAPITDYYPLLGMKTLDTLNTNGWFRLAKEDPTNPFYGVGEFGSGASGLASFEGSANGWAFIAQDGINTITHQKFDLYGALRNPLGGFYPPSRIYHSDNLVAGANVTFTPNADGQVVVASSGSEGTTGVSGTVNRIAKFNTTTSIGDSSMQDNGTGVGIQVAPETGYTVKIAGNIKYSGKSISPLQTLVFGSTTVWNMDQGENALLTLTGNSTLSVLNAVAGSCGIIEVRQDGTGGRILTLPTGTTSSGGNMTLTTTPNAVNILGFFFNGVNFRWKKDVNHF